jgi:hypothetical protein
MLKFRAFFVRQTFPRSWGGRQAKNHKLTAALNDTHKQGVLLSTFFPVLLVVFEGLWIRTLVNI